MSIARADIKFRKSENVSDQTSNGGKKGNILVVSGSRHNLFPRVTKNERTNGVTRYRKQFFSNENSSNETAYGVIVSLDWPTNGDDYILLASGSNTDIQSDVSNALTGKSFFGCGQLNSDVAPTDASIVLNMESNTIEFPNGGLIHISDKYSISQTIDTGVSIGDSIEYDSDLSKWVKIDPTDDITYPNGLYLGSNIVMTNQPSTHEEWLRLADNLYSNENIGTGDGTTSPALSDLDHGTNGICKQEGKRPVVSSISGGNRLSVTINRDGSCSGDCSAGQLNMVTGVWTTDIVWTSAIDNATDITITYRENCYSYSGNVATVGLSGNPANSYDADNTWGAGCLELGDIITSYENLVATTVSTGDYDDSTYPLQLHNDGTVEDTFTITFTSATAFSCSGASEGTVGTGTTSADFAPVNPNTGQPYFTLNKDGFSGTWQSGDTLIFDTHPSAYGIWLKEVVPAMASQAANNLCVLGFYAE